MKMSMSIRLRSCPRCQGDLFIEFDFASGQGWTCLQCGWRCEKDDVLGDYGVLADENGSVLKSERGRTHLRSELIEKE